MTPDCPPPQRLTDFLHGRLPEPDLEILAHHLSGCPSCADVANAIVSAESAGSFVGRLGHCLSTRPEEDPACRAMEDAAIAFIGLPVDGDSTRSLAPPCPPPEVGPVVGPYRIHEAVGHGGMGVVFRGEHTVTGRMAAVKVLRQTGRSGPEVAARFRVEARAVSRLAHRNIVAVYEFDEVDGLPFLAMEWVNGGTLAAVARNRLDARRAAEIVRDLARAVEYAHSRGVLHRDLKPSNVLLEQDGETSNPSVGSPIHPASSVPHPFRPKLADFGLAKLLDDEDRLTRTNAAIGTPSYMAPELAGGAAASGPAADIYGLGAILYECLTGVPPFKASTPVATVRLVCDTEAKPPSSHRPDVPAGLEAICLRCLRKSPGARYPSAASLADALDAWLRAGRWAAAVAVAGRVARATGRRWRGLVACLALAAVAAAVPLWDTDRPMRAAQRDIRAGRSTVLVGESGRPVWYRMHAGGPTTALDTATDGTFRVHASDLAMVELLPETPADHYRLTAKVRHEKSNRPGGVGLYAARGTQPSDHGDIDAFEFVSFDDVRGPPNVVLPRVTPKATNWPAMYTRLCRKSPKPLNIDTVFNGNIGPDFTPAGESLAGWREVSITVTPTRVLCAWEGHEFDMPVDLIDRQFASLTAAQRKRFTEDARLAAGSPTLAPRGGLGLYVERGSAAFRDVTVTPIHAD